MRYLLAVARHGTYSAAARQLKVTQTTVARRLESLGEAAGYPLFHRENGTLVPTDLTRQLIGHAEQMESEMANSARILREPEPGPYGLVRLTSVEGLLTDLLAPALPDFAARHPQIELELIISDNNLNLNQREADIALRLARPTEGSARTRKLSDLAMALYQSRDCATDSWLGYDDNMAHLPESIWFEKWRKGRALSLKTNSTRLLRHACREGMGQAVLACYRADRDPQLVRLPTDPEIPVMRELWMLVHPVARASQAVDKVIHWIDDLVEQQRPLLEGR